MPVFAYGKISSLFSLNASSILLTIGAQIILARFPLTVPVHRRRGAPVKGDTFAWTRLLRFWNECARHRNYRPPRVVGMADHRARRSVGVVVSGRWRALFTQLRVVNSVATSGHLITWSLS